MTRDEMNDAVEAIAGSGRYPSAARILASVGLPASRGLNGRECQWRREIFAANGISIKRGVKDRLLPVSKLARAKNDYLGEVNALFSTLNRRVGSLSRVVHPPEPADLYFTVDGSPYEFSISVTSCGHFSVTVTKRRPVHIISWLFVMRSTDTEVVTSKLLSGVDELSSYVYRTVNL